MNKSAATSPFYPRHRHQGRYDFAALMVSGTSVSLIPAKCYFQNVHQHHPRTGILMRESGRMLIPVTELIINRSDYYDVE